MARSPTRGYAALLHLSRTVRAPRIALETVRLRLWLVPALKRLPLHKLLERLDSPGSAQSTTRVTWPLQDVQQVTTLLLHGRSPLQATCLHRSLVRFALLRRANYPVRFQLGLYTDGSGKGHAWLELEGKTLFEAEPRRCVRTFGFGGDAAHGARVTATAEPPPAAGTIDRSVGPNHTLGTV